MKKIAEPTSKHANQIETIHDARLNDYFFHSSQIHRIFQLKKKIRIVYGIFVLNRRYAPNINQCGKWIIPHFTRQINQMRVCVCVSVRARKEMNIFYGWSILMKNKSAKE